MKLKLVEIAKTNTTNVFKCFVSSCVITCGVSHVSDTPQSLFTKVKSFKCLDRNLKKKCSCHGMSNKINISATLYLRNYAWAGLPAKLE